MTSDGVKLLPKGNEFLTLAEVAELLRYAGKDRERSVRRLFARHRISLVRRDRGTFLVTPDQLRRLIEALECSPSESAEDIFMSVERSVSVRKRKSSRSTLRDAIVEATRKNIERRLKAS